MTGLEGIFDKLCKDEIFPNDADWKEWLSKNGYDKEDDAFLGKLKEVLKREIKRFQERCPAYDIHWADYAYEKYSEASK